MLLLLGVSLWFVYFFFGFDDLFFVFISCGLFY